MHSIEYTVRQNPQTFNADVDMTMNLSTTAETWRKKTCTLDYPGSGTLDYPGSGTLGYPGSGTLGYPGSGTLDYPGSGTLDYPGSGQMPAGYQTRRTGVWGS